MESLKELIKENPAVFDDREPAEGHFERFEERLNRLALEKQPKRTLKFGLFAGFSAAASILLIVVTTVWLHPSPENAGQVEQPGKTDFSVTNRFYAEQMDEKITRIRCKLSAVSPDVRNQLEEDLHWIVAKNEQFVRNMQKEDNENLAVFYLVKHYRINLHTLEFISDKLGKDIEC